MTTRIKQLAKIVLPAPVYRRTGVLLYRLRYYLNLIFGYNKIASCNDYEEYWHQRIDPESHGLYIQRRINKFNRIAELIEPGSSVVEIGCGDGILLEMMLREKLRPEDVLGLDVSEAALDACREKGIPVRQADGTSVNFIKELRDYDYLIMSDFMEHIPDPEALIKLLRPKISKGIIISIPNSGFILYRLRLLFGKAPMQWAPKEFMGVHLRFWTACDLKWWAESLGFKVQTFIPLRGVPILRSLWSNMFSEVMIVKLKNNIRHMEPAKEEPNIFESVCPIPRREISGVTSSNTYGNDYVEKP